MPIVTLTTDFGNTDYYVASIKGIILSQLQDVTIVDISHNIPFQDIFKTAHIIKNCYTDFPPNTVHIIGVSSHVKKSPKYIVAYIHGQYFICANNGIFSLIFDTEPEQVFELTLPLDTDKICFPVKDVFVKAACHIARGGVLDVIGKPTTELNKKINFQATLQDNILRGNIVFIDYYGNLHTNIHESMFYNIAKGRRFTINLRSRSHSIQVISKDYNEVEPPGILALFNSSGYLEIAMNTANANKLTGLKVMDNFFIEFYD